MGFMATVRAIALMECMDQIYARQLRGTEVDADPHGTKAMAKAFLGDMKERTFSATGTTALVKQTGRSLSAALALKKAEVKSDVIPVRMLKVKEQMARAAAKIEPTHAHEIINVRKLKAQKQFEKAAATMKPTHAHEVISSDKIRELAASKERELQCDEVFGECSCTMPACTGGDDPDCATVFTSCMY